MRRSTGGDTTQEASGMADFYKRSMVGVIDFLQDRAATLAAFCVVDCRRKLTL
jgi:hypothetical protein